MDPLQIIVKGVVAKWADSVTLAGITGLDFEERRGGTAENPPAGTHFPYAVLRDLNGDTAVYSCASILTDCFLTIRIYGKTPEQCGDAAALVTAIFSSDALSLTLESGNLVSHRPLGSEYRQSDKNVHFVDLDYYFQHQASRT